MQKIEFLGSSSGEVTGSSYLLTSTSGNEILIDFGMFQGDDKIVALNYSMLLFNAQTLEGVFLTHAHLDHCGRLPLLVQAGFMRKIYMTVPTKALVQTILFDSARIAEKDPFKRPIYTEDDVLKTLDMIETVEYGQKVTLKSFSAEFFDAGHILGSSSIVITDTTSENQEKIVFSGDLGNTPQSIVKPTHYIDSADYVVMESTYGDSSHPEEDTAGVIAEEINEVERTHGVLLIPAFAVERTQEILHIIHHLKKDGKININTPVFLDSPMGIEATYTYLDFKDHYNEEIQNHNDNPFSFEELMVTEEARDSKKILKIPGPKVIIAGSGMMSGGRILHHSRNYLSDKNTRILFVGYQAEETMGRQILEGASTVRIDDESFTVRAHIREIKSLSSHADLPRLMKWISHIKGVRKIFLTHGEDPQREFLAEKIKSELSIKDVYLPTHEQVYEL